jgi:hypothetical protein
MTALSVLLLLGMTGAGLVSGSVLAGYAARSVLGW